MNEKPGMRPVWQWLLPAIVPCVAFSFWPWFNSPFLGTKTTILLAFAAVAAFAIFRKESKTALPGSFLQWSAIVWGSVFVLSALCAHNWAESWHVMALGAAGAIFFLGFLREKVSGHVLLWAISVSAILVAAVAISGRCGYDLPRLFLGIAAPGRMRAASTLGNPLFVASYLSISIWPAFIVRRPAGRILIALIVLAGMLVTAERTALFAFLAGAACLAFCATTLPRRNILLLTCALLLIVAHTGIFRNPRSLKTTMQGRIFLWKTALRHITLLGHGPGSFYHVYNQNLREIASTIPASEYRFVNYETDAYNIYVQAIVETGLLGLLAMQTFLAGWFYAAWKARQDPSVACALAAVTAFLATGLCDDPLSRPEGMALLSAWLAIPFLSSSGRKLFRDNPASFKLESSRSGNIWISPVAASLLFLILLSAAAITAFTNYAVHAGVQAEYRGDWLRAERWNRAALSFDPAQRDARYNLVRVLARSGQYHASIEESERALDWVNEAELHVIRIRILPMVGKTAQAQEELTRARKEFPWSKQLQQESVPDGN